MSCCCAKLSQKPSSTIKISAYNENDVERIKIIEELDRYSLR